MKETIKKLRDETGAGVMDCKRALEQADGVYEKALVVLEEQGRARSEKLADRVGGAGRIESYVHDGRIGALVEVTCNTDFVARNKDFQKFCAEVAMHVVGMSPLDVDELLTQPSLKNPEMTMEDVRANISSIMGENIVITEFTRRTL